VALPFVVGIGYLCFCIGAFSCDTFEADIGDFFSEKQKYGYRGYGDSDGSCLKYDFDEEDDDDDLPGAIRAGRALGIIGGVFGAVVLLLSMYSPFFYVPKGIFQAIGIAFGIVMIVLTGIIFFLGLLECGPFRDNPNCETSVRRPVVSVVGWVIWIALVVMFACLRGPRKVATQTTAPSPTPQGADAPPKQETDDVDL